MMPIRPALLWSAPPLFLLQENGTAIPTAPPNQIIGIRLDQEEMVSLLQKGVVLMEFRD